MPVDPGKNWVRFKTPQQVAAHFTHLRLLTTEEWAELKGQGVGIAVQTPDPEGAFIGLWVYAGKVYEVAGFIPVPQRSVNRLPELDAQGIQPVPESDDELGKNSFFVRE